MALVDDDLLEVREELGVIDCAAYGGEGDTVDLLLPHRGGIDSAVDDSVGAEFAVVLLEYLLAGLEYECMSGQP